MPLEDKKRQTGLNQNLGTGSWFSIVNECRNLQSTFSCLVGWRRNKGIPPVSFTQQNLQEESAQYAQESICHRLLQPVPSVGSNMFPHRKTLVISLCLFIRYPNSHPCVFLWRGVTTAGLISLCANRLPRRESYHGQQFWESFLSSAWQPQHRHLKENFVFQACFQQGNSGTNQTIWTQHPRLKENSLGALR